MQQDLELVKDKFKVFPRKKLAFFPTPVHKLEKLSELFGVNLYLKRDDLSGIIEFSGNKMRKLEYLLGDAIAQGADTVITFGPTQSNHAMQTVSACRAAGLKPILYLTTFVDFDENDIRANMLVDEIMGAEIHIVPSNGEPMFIAYERSYALAKERAEELKSEGHKAYTIPVGGTSPVGDIGFAEAIIELHQQMMDAGVKMDYIAHSTGSGGMLAGLAAGKALIESDVKILSFRASEKKDDHPDWVAEIATEILQRLGSDKKVTAQDLNMDATYFGPGYEKPNALSDEAIKLLARNEGILIDPVYGSKALAGLFDYIRKGKVPKGSNVVFWHTGGTVAFFAEKEIIGDIKN